MTLSTRLACVVLVLYVFDSTRMLASGDEDPCKRRNRVELDGQIYRSANMSSPHGSLTCDRNLNDGWYYFHASTGSAMVNRCVETHHCGTKNTAWLLGDNPTPLEGIVDRRACVTGSLFDCSLCAGGQTWCCSELHDIKVKNCGDYFVYKLQRPTGCPVGYCIGDKLPQQCLPPNATKPQCKDVFTPIPQLTATKGVRPRDGKTNEIQFHCDNSYDPHDTNIVFDVDWFINDVKVKSERLSRGLRKSVLHESDWADKGQTLGFQIFCSLNGSYPGGPVAKRMDSKPYYAGLRVRAWDFRIDENSFTSIHLTPTVPIIAVRNCEGDCDATITVEVDEHPSTCLDGTSIPQVTVEGSCGIVFKPKAENIETMLTFKLAASVDGKYDKEQVATVRITTDPLGIIHDAWKGYKESFQVTIVDKDLEMSASRCEILPGSFVTTFDGHIYLAREEGEFILYRNKKRAFQINVFQRQCGSSRTCTCAVAIMSATDGIVIDMCLPVSDPSRKPQLKVIQTGCDFIQGSLRLLQKNDGRGYEIFLPTGGYVEVLAVGDSLSVFMFPSTLDWQQTEGLCGLFNKNCMDDLRAKGSTTSVGQADECIRAENTQRPPLREYKDFITSFRVTIDRSLYRYTFDKTKYLPPDLGNLYCNCHGPTKPSCHRLGHVESCYPPEVSSVRDITVHHTESCRMRRSIASNIAYIDDEQQPSTYTYNASYRAQTLSWPLRSGLTEAETRRACEEVLIKSELGMRCSAVQFVDVTDKLEFCVETVKMTGDLNKASIIADSLKQHCMLELRRNVSSWINVSNPTSGGYRQTLPQDVTDVLCPSNCTRNGKCVEGTCQCNYGFIGSDCSVSTMTPPGAYYIPKSGLCDVTKEPCAAVLVVGYDFVYSKTLTCHFRPFGLTSEVDASQLPTFSSEAVFETFARVVCILPKDVADGNILGFDVSVSNDGRTQSVPLQVVPFDSTCMDCTTGRHPPCTVKLNTCGVISKCNVACIETSFQYLPSSSQTWSSSSAETTKFSFSVDGGQSRGTSTSSSVIEIQMHTSLEGSTVEGQQSATSFSVRENQSHVTFNVQSTLSPNTQPSSAIEGGGIPTSHVGASSFPSSSLGKSGDLRSDFTMSNVALNSASITALNTLVTESTNQFEPSPKGVESTEHTLTSLDGTTMTVTNGIQTSIRHDSWDKSLGSSSWKFAASSASVETVAPSAGTTAHIHGSSKYSIISSSPNIMIVTTFQESSTFLEMNSDDTERATWTYPSRLSASRPTSIELEDSLTSTIRRLSLSRRVSATKSPASWLIQPTPAVDLLHTLGNSNTPKENGTLASITLHSPQATIVTELSTPVFSQDTFSTENDLTAAQTTSALENTSTDTERDNGNDLVIGTAVGATAAAVLLLMMLGICYRRQLFVRFHQSKYQSGQEYSTVDYTDLTTPSHDGFSGVTVASTDRRYINSYAMQPIDRKRQRKTGKKTAHKLDKDVLEFLKRLNLERFAANFEREEITSNTLQTLKEDDLTDKLNKVVPEQEQTRKQVRHMADANLEIPLGPAKEIMNSIQQMEPYEQIPDTRMRESYANNVYMHLDSDLNHGPRQEYSQLSSAQAKIFSRQNLKHDSDPYWHLSSNHQADDAHVYDSLDCISTKDEGESRNPVMFVNPAQQPVSNLRLEQENINTGGHDFDISSDYPDGDPIQDTKRTNSTTSLVSNSSVSSQLTAKRAWHDVEVPAYFRCALTQEIMKNPVSASDGYTYERSAILKWQSTHKTSPATQKTFENKEIEPCFALRREIKEWLRVHGNPKKIL